MSDAPALEVEGLEFSYGHVPVLFGCDLRVGSSETVALLGNNGAGKTTLLRLVSGLERPSHGTVRLRGVDVTSMAAEDRYRAGIVHLRGGAGVFPGLTVKENLRATRLRSPRPNERPNERPIERGFDLFPELADKAGRRAGSLSGGEQQMLALAMCLIQEPALLLIDELSIGLAPQLVQRLIAIVGSLRAARVAMIIVEQSVNLALSIADRAVVLDKGEVRFEGSARELQGRDDILGAVLLERRGPA